MNPERYLSLFAVYVLSRRLWKFMIGLGETAKLYGKCHDFKLPLMHCTLNQPPKPLAAFGQAAAAFAENKEAETTPQVH